MNFSPWVVETGVQKECRRYYMAKDRCTNPNNKDYKRYGARGIEFKLDSFKRLIEELGPCPLGLTLDRIDNSKHYEWGNLRWTTPLEQACNRRPQYNSRKHHAKVL
jgi:hypothetical protein